MTKICREAESSLDYYALFKSILKEAPQPMSPLESLASSAVRTAHKVSFGLTERTGLHGAFVAMQPIALGQLAQDPAFSRHT